MTTENQLAQQYEDAARTLRSLPAGAPEHTEVLTTVASWMDKHATEARGHGYNDRWSSYDEPGHAQELHDLALRLTSRPQPAPEDQ